MSSKLDFWYSWGKSGADKHYDLPSDSIFVGSSRQQVYSKGVMVGSWSVHLNSGAVVKVVQLGDRAYFTETPDMTTAKELDEIVFGAFGYGLRSGCAVLH